MSPNASISLIICTHNRAASLERTLAALAAVRVPAGWPMELLVVDNASTDGTAAVVRAARLSTMEIRYVAEPREGKSHALNAGAAQARGDFLLFTDDDVAPREDWIERLMAPLVSGSCDAVNGQVLLAPGLRRPWLTLQHRMWLAESVDAHGRDWSRELIGANQGFRRSVLARVPAWDPELGPGPGAVGFCEDTLFGRQLAEAGFKIAYAPEAVVVHHLDASRLQRRYWLDDARKRGRTQAYLRYHWEHDDLVAPRVKLRWFAAKLGLRRVLQPPPPPDAEGCPPWEMSYVFHLEMCRQFCRERRRARNYQKRGLTRRVEPGSRVPHAPSAVNGPMTGPDQTPRSSSAAP
jgi:glucosyl-dolichyl phosphate glucuronosyltransferase